MIYKNVAGQKLAIYAFDPTVSAGTNPAKTGDAANITAQISKDGSTLSAATNDVNPTELGSVTQPGIYVFDLTQAETNADLIVITPVSSTSNVLIDPVVVLTTEVATLQSGLATEAKQDTIDTVVDAIKVVTDQFVFTVANQVDANVLTQTATPDVNLVTVNGSTVTLNDLQLYVTSGNPLQGTDLTFYQSDDLHEDEERQIDFENLPIDFGGIDNVTLEVRSADDTVLISPTTGTVDVGNETLSFNLLAAATNITSTDIPFRYLVRVNYTSGRRVTPIEGNVYVKT